MPYKTKPLTETFAHTELAPTLLQVGASRSELIAAAGAAVIAQGKDLAWVRVRSSSSATLVAYGGIAPGAATLRASDERNWHTQNLFFSFATNGKVSSVQRISDADLLKVLRQHLASGALDARDFSTPTIIEVPYQQHLRTETITLELRASELILRHGEGRNVEQLPPSALVGIEHRHTCAVTGTNETLCEAVEFRVGNRRETYNLRMHARDVFAVLAYIQRFQPLPR